MEFVITLKWMISTTYPKIRPILFFFCNSFINEPHRQRCSVKIKMVDVIVIFSFICFCYKNIRVCNLFPIKHFAIGERMNKVKPSAGKVSVVLLDSCTVFVFRFSPRMNHQFTACFIAFVFMLSLLCWFISKDSIGKNLIFQNYVFGFND